MSSRGAGCSRSRCLGTGQPEGTSVICNGNLSPLAPRQMDVSCAGCLQLSTWSWIPFVHHCKHYTIPLSSLQGQDPFKVTQSFPLLLGSDLAYGIRKLLAQVRSGKCRLFPEQPCLLAWQPQTPPHSYVQAGVTLAQCSGETEHRTLTIDSLKGFFISHVPFYISWRWW